ncbi:MAG: RNA polymerase factor sigma-32 [Deltaproteobacteria bacterium]|nr:RNA polymerase factor sigma-32 [Deltaproteobacteria bacterium]
MTQKKTLSKERALSVVDPLGKYLQEVDKYPFVTLEEERALAEDYRKNGNIEAAKKLVTAHLRLVVKIAMEYRQAYYNVLDLIQEGNVGLMHAVKKFDPDKARFSSYASWWIRSMILKYILDNFRLIKIGTTKDQKKLFYNLMKEKQKIEALGFKPSAKLLASSLEVSEKAVNEMSQRLTHSEYGLEAPVGGGDSDALLKDFIAADQQPLDEQVARQETQNILETKLAEFSEKLGERDMKIFSQRLMADLPITLQEIADEYGISKERVRQIEERIIKNLRSFFKEHGIKPDMLQRG